MEELNAKIDKKVGNLKQLLSNNLHKDDWIDLSISSVISLPFALKMDFANNMKFMANLSRCDHESTIKNILAHQNNLNKLIPAACIGLFALKNLYYDMKYLSIINKYNEKLRKLNKHCSKLGYQSSRINLTKLNDFKNIATAKYACKYSIPVCMIGALYCDDPAIPIISGILSFSGYLFARFIENDIANELLD